MDSVGSMDWSVASVLDRKVLAVEPLPTTRTLESVSSLYAPASRNRLRAAWGDATPPSTTLPTTTKKAPGPPAPSLGEASEGMDKRVGGIDAILFRYSFRRYGDLELNRAIEACHKAGIGLMAMKTMGSVPAELEAVAEFESKQFTLLGVFLVFIPESDAFIILPTSSIISSSSPTEPIKNSQKPEWPILSCDGVLPSPSSSNGNRAAALST